VASFVPFTGQTKRSRKAELMETTRPSSTPTTAGILLGVGLGGFFDGIVLHQLLQWHHMLSNTDRWPTTTVDGLEANTLADGFFHAGVYVLTVAGLALLWTNARQTHQPWSTMGFIGCLLFGWGLFNVVEGIVDHQILALHHVRHGENHLAWDLAFLLWGAAMLLGGLLLMRQGRRAALQIAQPFN
jgi:uncharacterized membrane protein